MTRYYSRRKSLTTDNEVDVNLTPMLDVVFILLIFFIITASFIQQTTINITPAKAALATSEQVSVQIGIDRYGDIYLDNQVIDIRTLQNIAEKMYIQNPQSAITIMADKASDNAALIRVLDSISRAGIKNIAIAAEVDG
ncbi:MAG: biopolymer transporter ExbD [Chromatiales bacterium]|nr:biopolymer transporter ExbD [Chromatiales bacterium]